MEGERHLPTGHGGSSGSNSRASNLARRQPPQPITNRAGAPEAHQANPPTPDTMRDEGTTNFEEAVRLAHQVGQGWGRLNLEERRQDIGAILGLLRQGRRWLQGVKRTSSWELQSMAEARSGQAEEELLIAASYPEHSQATHHLQQAQYHMEACLGAEASALEVSDATAGGEPVHPADTLGLAAGGQEAPASTSTALQTNTHPALRARAILRRLRPFTQGDVRGEVEAALRAVEEWSEQLWGAELLAIEDTPEGGGQGEESTHGGEEMAVPPLPAPLQPTHEQEGQGQGAPLALVDGDPGQDQVPDRENGKDTNDAVHPGEASGDVQLGADGERGEGASRQEAPTMPETHTQATVPWQPPPVRGVGSGGYRRRWESQQGWAANRRRSQRRRMGFGVRTRRSRSGGTRRRRTTSPRPHLIGGDEHRRRRAHAGLE